MKKCAKMVQKWLGVTLTRRQLLQFCLVVGMLVGMLAHGFMFANKIPNHDSPIINA